MKKQYAIGSDIGGSHISVVAVDLNSEKILTETFSSCKIDNKGTALEILENWKMVLEKTMHFIERSKVSGIGFAMPGPFDYENGIALFTKDVAKYENLHGIDVAQKIREILSLEKDCEVRFMNDATSFAVGESWLGEAASYSRLIAITLGTGFGSAFIDQGIPVVDRKDVPRLGCLWHQPFRDGIADDYFSTRWFINSFTELCGETLPGVREIAERAETDPNARKLFEEFGNNLGVFLEPWVRKFTAESIVIGGNIAGAWDLFGPSFLRELKTSALNTKIYLSTLGETAAMIGSARLMDEDFWRSVKPLLSKM